ncbi:unnamed protein product [Acanthoscelides obtectus]|uniref:DNA-directed DNA polymerase n=1 Tax=Acanthoscelides obtectus TaxID=200917 RepID=A0A9P0QEJ4_ACAOB|nr:unnamed protein product [Acanthoscelides obtectus]CAK1683002.1 hypothetical protein AOBTE_LOCUS34035 [Acanthoscelides obtectus]
MLNSFWGKFAQKENQNKTSIVRDCGEFFDMLTNPSIHVNTVLPVNEETLLITWEFREEAYDVSSTVNVVLASYVTALARLKLYSFLEKVEERAVYVDTDSCIYISRKGLDDISTGDFIGDMTDELNGGFISEFVSGGPKNYAYKYTTLSGEEQIKVEERAVYVDTDSCIYISRKGLDDISTGDFIGDMTDELNGGFISEFVSGGPKNYAYKYTTLSGEEQIVCKVKAYHSTTRHPKWSILRK